MRSNIKISKIVLIFAGLLGITQFACSQGPDVLSGHGILGYLDARTGAFRPAIHTPVEREETISTMAAISPTTGKLVFNVTINVESSFPSNEVITCEVGATTIEMIGYTVGGSFLEQASALATRSGSKATCTVTIPYSWSLATAGQDSITLTIGITAVSGSTVSRESAISLPSIKVPSNGSTTTQAIGATI